MYWGCGGGILQEIVTGPPNYRLQTWLHRSDWYDSSATMSFNVLRLLKHTHSHRVDVLTPSPAAFPQTSQDGSSVWPRSSGWNEALDI